MYVSISCLIMMEELQAFPEVQGYIWISHRNRLLSEITWSVEVLDEATQIRNLLASGEMVRCVERSNHMQQDTVLENQLGVIN